MAVIFTRAFVPNGLENEWLQHLRDFDRKHAGCVFQVMIDPAPEKSMAEIIEMCVVEPGLTFQQVFERANTCTICKFGPCQYPPGREKPPADCKLRHLVPDIDAM